MNIYTSTDFKGHWPVGVAAVVIAKDKRQAVRLLKASLKEVGLEQEIFAKNLDLISADDPKAILLCDGTY